jgi:hypothetical protein
VIVNYNSDVILLYSRITHARIISLGVATTKRRCGWEDHGHSQMVVVFASIVGSSLMGSQQTQVRSLLDYTQVGVWDGAIRP